MPRTIRRVIFSSVAAAFATFCVVQDQVTRAGAERYVRLQQDALAGRGPAVRIDDVMRPAVQSSVKQGLLWGAVVLCIGLGSAVIIVRRTKSTAQLRKPCRPQRR